MCIGEISRLADAWEDGGVRIGRLESGSVVTLSFVPDAARGSYVLVHLGIPVEVLESQVAEEALALREEDR